MEKIRFPIPIKFRNHLEYCSINLSELTRETFLADAISVVPKGVPTSNIENMRIYDDENALVPIHLVKDVIKLHVHRKGFHLRIEFGKKRRHVETSTTISSDELRSYFIANHLGHIVSKSEKNEGKIEKREINQLIRVAFDFLITLTGVVPGLNERESTAAAICNLFPHHLTLETALAKLNDRKKNYLRNQKDRATVRACIIPDQKTGSTNSPAHSNPDYDDLVVSQCITAVHGKKEALGAELVDGIQYTDVEYLPLDAEDTMYEYDVE